LCNLHHVCTSNITPPMLTKLFFHGSAPKRGKVSCAPSTSVLPCSLKIRTINFRFILLLDTQVRSILYLNPPTNPSTSYVFLLLDLNSMIQNLRKHESMDVLRAHDTFPPKDALHETNFEGHLLQPPSLFKLCGWVSVPS
jgi:hypothetical protein